jgi:hypothetical protein
MCRPQLWAGERSGKASHVCGVCRSSSVLLPEITTLEFFDALELCCNCENLVKKKLDDVSGGTNFFSHQAGVRAQCTGTRGDFFRGRHGARDRERGRDVQGEYSLTVRKLSIRV